MALIFSLSAQPNPLPALTERVWDKALHTVEYAALGLLFCRALIGEGLAGTGAVVLAIVLTSAYASSDEWHQMFTPGRSSDLKDWTADTFGGALGTAAYVFVQRRGTHSPQRRTPGQRNDHMV
jgi:VanZ family protein